MKGNAALIAVIVALIAVLLMRGEDQVVQELRDKLAALEEVDAYRTELVREADRRAAVAVAERDSLIALAAAETADVEAGSDSIIEAQPIDVQAIVRPIIEAERAAHRLEVAAIHAANLRAELRHMAQLERRDSLIVTLREQIATGAELTDELDGRMTILGLKIPKPRCVAGVGFAAGSGRAVGAGVTCGVPL